MSNLSYHVLLYRNVGDFYKNKTLILFEFPISDPFCVTTDDRKNWKCEAATCELSEIFSSGDISWFVRCRATSSCFSKIWRLPMVNIYHISFLIPCSWYLNRFLSFFLCYHGLVWYLDMCVHDIVISVDWWQFDSFFFFFS